MIKSTMLLAFVFLLFALASQPQLGAADASHEQVVDTSGKILRADTKYYIIPVTSIPICKPYEKRCRIIGKSLGLSSIGEPCPLDVVVVDRYLGLPLTFTPINSKKGVIRVSTDLNIKFVSSPPRTTTTCPRKYSTVWKLEHSFEDVSKKRPSPKVFVSTGGVVGNPGWGTINNWFKIEKYGDIGANYKLVYCPSVVKPFKPHVCKDVGVFVDEKGNKRLALSDVPLKVKFQQA